MGICLPSELICPSSRPLHVNSTCPLPTQQVWKKMYFPGKIVTFPTISYVFLYWKIQNFPPNGHISLEGASWFPHFFPPCHPVNCLAHRIGLMGTTIIKNRQFRHGFFFFFFAKLTNPKGETTLKQPGWQYLSAILKLVNIINTP